MTVDLTIRSEADAETILAIAQRAFELALDAGRARPRDVVRLTTDVTAVHNHVPLDLAGLLSADDHSFSRDVFGIVRHLDRETGTLTRRFLPRFAMASRESEAGGARAETARQS